MEKREPKTQEEARRCAIDWQNRASTQSFSYEELADWTTVFSELGERFDLKEEFEENGIL